MKTDKVVKSLRDISKSFENGNDGTSFDICGECKNAADLLEQQQTEIKRITKDRDQWKVAAEASRDVIQPKLRAEIEELKASQPVRCGECKNFDFGMEYACRCKNGIAQDSYVDKNDYCSYGERRVEE